MSVDLAKRAHAVLELALLDAPTIDARVSRDPEKLEELARDILRRGLIEPLKVGRVGERFEVVDGFRRYLACKSAGVDRVECFIYPMKALALEGVKYATGAYREDFSPADEAIYFYRLFTEECGEDIERVAAVVGRKVTYVDGRLQLVNGDELVFDALKDRQIPIGVAHELNKVEDAEYRRYFLRHAVSDGATVTTVAGWIQQYRLSIVNHQHAAAPAASTPAIATAPAHDPMKCYVCGLSDRRIPEQISVHGSCREAILDALLKKGMHAEDEFSAAPADARRI